MSSSNGITVREHIEKLFDEFKKRYESEQKSQDTAFEEFKKTLDKEGKLLAEKYKSDLMEYPNIADFNELKEKVIVEFSAALAKDKIRLYTMSVMSLIIGFSTLIFLIWSKTK